MKNQLTKIQNDFLFAYCAFHPTTATSLGIEGFGEALGDFSVSSRTEYLSRLRNLFKRVGALSFSRRAVDDPIDQTLLENKIRLEEWELARFCSFRKDPGLYVNEVLYGLWFLLVRPFSKEEKLKGILGRLERVPDFFAAAKTHLENPPPLWVKIALGEIKGLKGFLGEILKECLRRYPLAKREIRNAVKLAEGSTFNFEKYLKTLLPKAEGTFSVGKKDFEFLLKTYHGFSQNSREILEIGRRIFSETEELLQETAARIKKGKSWRELVEEIKGDHPTAKDLLSVYRREVARLKRFLKKKKLVSIPPGERLKVIATPEFARSTIPFAAYVDPPLFARDRTGHFFVTPVTGKGETLQSYLREHSHASMIVTALHEGYPGHHLQFVYQANLDRPIRKLFNSSSYYEGWALYTEELMGEMGYYDLRVRLLQLKDKLWRACRVIVDVGMHTQGMTDDEAVEFLAKNARMAKAAARADVNWYTQRPTVPLSYLTGMLKIRSLRDRAEKIWGKEFSLHRFHDWFLQWGAIPIPFIEKALFERSS